jgi:hypothetical protein
MEHIKLPFPDQLVQLLNHYGRLTTENFHEPIQNPLVESWRYYLAVTLPDGYYNQSRRYHSPQITSCFCIPGAVKSPCPPSGTAYL